MAQTKDHFEEIFRKNEIFSQLTEAQKKLIRQNTVVIKYQRKETIFKQHANASHIIFVKEGLVKLNIEGDNDKKLIVSIAKPRDFIGLSEIYGNRYYDFTAVAIKDTLLFQIRVEDFKKLVEENNDFAISILKWYCQNMEYMYQKVFALGTKQMHGRLADIILDLCQKDFEREKVYMYLTRKDLAEFSGMSTESAIRLLTEFKNDGLIRIEGRSIYLNNLELLQRLSRIG